ncbi:MAG TPA: tRNA adenosine(34) deaminase TadA [Bryobacteraceae bacterium]|nr:tRNA adenosine(34) deaminase TadA [Bryobacteraceae bacterium]
MDERRVTEDEVYMRDALDLAREAEDSGEVPVGAVVVLDGTVIGRGRNSPVSLNDPTAHAEILALREAGATVANYRLPGATLYVTLEPCVMCAGALVAARISRLVFGARDLRFGGVRSKFRVADSELLNHRVEIVEGVMGVDCAKLLQAFFDARR